MEKLYDGRFEFPNPYTVTGVPRSACRLRVWREPGMPRLFMVATELDDNPGASVTNAAEVLAAAAWGRFQPEVVLPPILIEHYGQESYEGGRRVDGRPADAFALVEFARLAGDWEVAGPRWSYMPAAFVERLLGEPVGAPVKAETGREEGASS